MNKTRILILLSFLIVAFITYGQSRINGHEAVDLGLSVKWATCNIGAYKPSDYGNYYAWGETVQKNNYSSENYSVPEGITDIKKTNRDVAHTLWGGSWRLPTNKEINELLEKCYVTFETIDGHNGIIFTGPNGNSIFLPYAGWIGLNSYYDVNSFGQYWTCEGTGMETGCVLTIGNTLIRLSANNSAFGRSIRPVTD